ncbi:hypothetical protein [Agromyces sp. NPDC058064]|uniref:InlB B-repeat-containing protein n=1 Tax=Agromyces sp. NPDC058064 TaxID=3346322 RepID=UPI0036DC912D
MSKPGAGLAHAADGDVRARKRSSSVHPLRRLAAAVTALVVGAGLALVGVAAPAAAHTGDLTAKAVCNVETGEYDVTYTLKLSNVPDGKTGTTNWRVGTSKFDGTPRNADDMDRGPLTSKGNTTLTLGTESLPGDTVGNGPWVYAFTSWDKNNKKGSDGRIEGLTGDCGNESTVKKITFCHATGSATNPYVRLTTSVSAFLNAGHIDHQNRGDIYPEFTYKKPGKNGQLITVRAQGDQSLLQYEDCTKPPTRIAVPTASFADECGVDNYVLSYDKKLEGVVWSESVAGGKVTLTAKPAAGYVFEGGKSEIVFGPWTLNQKPCDVLIPVPTQASFADECGVDNYVLSYDKELTGVVWSESVVDGEVTLTAKPAAGYVFEGGKSEIVFGPWTLNQKPCDEKIAAPVATFTDECGVDNYVLSYDKELTGVVWSESVVDGKVTLTATPAEGYAFENGESEIVFGPWTLNQKPCDVLIPVPTQASFADTCGPDNESLAYDKELAGVVWSESVADGKITLTATPAAGYVFEGGKSEVVFGPWTLDDEPCIAPVLDGSVATGVCEADAPWISYKVTLTDPDDQATSREVSLILSDGEHTETLALGTLNDDGILEDRVLWPGASVDDEGNATGWPGWKQLGDGTWVQTDDNFAWTRNLTSATFVVNPELDVELAYPPATPDCIAAPPVTPGGEGETPSTPAGDGLADTGFAGTTIAIVAGVVVLAGIAFLVIARLRRKQS